MGIHPTSSSVAAFDGGGIRDGVVQLFQTGVDAALRTVGIANVDCDQALSVAMLDDLSIGQCTRNAVTNGRQATTGSLPTGTVGLSKNFREQTGITDLAVGKQNQPLRMAQPFNGIFQQPSDEAFVPSTLHMSNHKLTDRVDNFGFPLRMTFVLDIAMSFVHFQRDDIKRLRPFVMKRLGMLSDFPIQPPYHARMHF